MPASFRASCMVLFEPVHGGAALRWCGRFRAGTCATATVFTITNLVPGGGPINLLTEQLAGMPLLSAAGLVTFLASGVLLSLYFGSLVLSQKLAQHRLRRLRSDTGAIPRTFLYLRSFDHGKSSLIDRIRRIFEHGTVGPFARAVYKMHDPEEEIAHAVASAMRDFPVLPAGRKGDPLSPSGLRYRRAFSQAAMPAMAAASS